MDVAPRIEMDTVRSGYADLCRHLRDRGVKVAPRGLTCYEVTGATVVVHDVTHDAIPVGLGRRANPAIGAAEALQLVGGVSTPQLLARIAPTFERFRDGEVLHGAYGPRIRYQTKRVVRRLVRDPDTRQAVLAIWDPAYDLHEPPPADLPCTLGFQFLIRDGELEMHTTMRSNDAWWGFAYDVAQFSALQLTVANVLGVPPGVYVHRAGSLHLYERDLDDVDGLAPRASYESIPPLGLWGGTIDDVQARARALLAGAWPDAASSTERWYRRVLSPYLETKEDG